MPQISTRATSLQASPLRKLVGLADERKKNGVKVYHLNIGQPDLPTSPAFYNALRELSDNPIAYERSQGNVNAIDAWREYYATLGADLTREQVVITTSGSEALQFTINMVADAGDEIVVFEPFYTNYNAFATIGNVKLHPVTLDIETGFHLPSDEEIEKAINGRTKAILVCNPSNPTGTVLRKDEMDRLVALAEKHDLFLLADEVYREFVFDGEAQTFLSYPDPNKRIIIVDSVSKRFNLCGARIGVIVSKNEDLMKSAVKFCMSRLASPTIEQVAMVPVLKEAAQTIPPLIAEWRKRRDVVGEWLAKIPGVKAHTPEGAFYIICELPVDSAEKFCQWTAAEFVDNNETVLVAPAPGFYATPGKGEKEIRIAYVLNTKDLERSMELLKLALEAYNNK
jgi:aspartate aminotransferase